MTKLWCRLAYWLVIRWPFNTWGITRPIYFWLLPYAGDWAYWYSEGFE